MSVGRVVRSMATDRHNNPELVRIVTLLAGLVCLIVFVESNVYYAITAKAYDLGVVGKFMDKFSQSFAWIVGTGAAGISARNFAERNHRAAPQQEEVEVNAEH